MPLDMNSFPAMTMRVPDEIRSQPIEYLRGKVKDETVDYLIKKKCVTIEDFIQKQDKIAKKHKAKVNGYLMFGVENL